MSLIQRLAVAHDKPHAFTIQYPPGREYFQKSFRSAPADIADFLSSKGGLSSLSEFGLYLHVPFCRARCLYCNFPIDTRRDTGLFAGYVDTLIRQLGLLADTVPASSKVYGIDIGGGTPTLLPQAEMGRLLKALGPWRARSSAKRPLSVETGPETASREPEKFAMMRSLGVGRVSLGVQTAEADLLVRINRKQQRLEVESALKHLKDAGFERINIDLIFGLPGQGLAEWRADLKLAAGLLPDSITTYDCLYRGKGRGFVMTGARPPSPAVYGKLYEEAYTFLTSKGYHAPYGSVNFSLHRGETGSSAYFEGRLLDGLSYLGVGQYASSMVGCRWWFAPMRLWDWMKAVQEGSALPAEDCYSLPEDERLAKQILWTLSFGYLDLERFREAFGWGIKPRFSRVLEAAQEKGWLARKGNRYCMAPGSFRHLPELRALFYTDGALDWVRTQEDACVPA
ncbi:MAG: coproporphyrinogen III oxidase family protein [Elusimicrobia bacterium]|nr:coproporphyrinogen III oxidase family protein [Elusimicrobiota bacterium]